MVVFCEQNNLVIGNTRFDQPKRRLHTWNSPNGLYRNQIDFITVQKRWRSSLRSVKTRPRADCGSDHELLIAEIKGRLQKNNEIPPPKRYDLQNISEQYKITVRNRFQELALIDKDPEKI